ncbi:MULTISPECIES: Abi family protein [Flagellimonas]|uniref:Abortive infection bacteriophage resistance protein n=2 Tax=Flagellimonas TaxID=444459 RepID=A0A1H2RC51_9FLAO|nr:MULTISPECIES: Abi family protein [Allomuricauda]MDF0706251.1 Abi family protein [[Muricauda] okinawensis]SDQ61985.1 Abortive infection bacteriophage resistance protein [Allomuricauda zhangzhouensis]SDW16941.1 Abortive infection bacteriophage resistance protein [Allomuricauda zhangzhouensis]
MFEKPAFTKEQQLKQLKDRGLHFSNDAIALKYLSHISYYRLGEYWYVMQEDKENHTFKADSKFDDVVALYNFDAELRLLLFGVIEKIEISLRTKLIYHLSHEFDPWWFQNFELFSDSRALVKTLFNLEEEISRTKDKTIKNHLKKHKDDQRFPPSWKSLEHTSFGSLSKLYGNLKNTIKSKDTIAEEFGAVNHTYLPSWLQSIAQIRNFCAHHSRLWNRNLPGTVKLLPKPPNPWISDLDNVPKQHEFSKLYVHLCLMKYLLDTVQPNNNFGEKLVELFTKFPNVDPDALGMKPDWKKEPLWK